MDNKDILSGLEALIERARLAERKIEYSSSVERLERKVKELEEELGQIKNIVRMLYEGTIKNNR